MIFSDDLEKIFGKRPWGTEEPLPEKPREVKTADNGQSGVTGPSEAGSDPAGKDVTGGTGEGKVAKKKSSGGNAGKAVRKKKTSMEDSEEELPFARQDEKGA